MNVAFGHSLVFKTAGGLGGCDVFVQSVDYRVSQFVERLIQQKRKTKLRGLLLPSFELLPSQLIRDTSSETLRNKKERT